MSEIVYTYELQPFMVKGRRFVEHRFDIPSAERSLRRALEEFTTAHGPIHHWRTEPEVSTDVDFQTKQFCVQLYARGWLDRPGNKSVLVEL